MTNSPLLHRFLGSVGDVSALDEATRTVTFVASTPALDSYGTIVEQEWDLSRFESNPVVLWGHDRDFPIGTAKARVEGGQLLADVTFDAEDETAVRVWGLVKRKVVRGISVGFRAGVTSFVDAPGGSIPVYSANELYELSITALPSNKEALARAAELSHQEHTMADSKAQNPAPEANVAPVADILSRADHEGILRDTRNTCDTAIRAMQLTVEKASKDKADAEERAAVAEKRIKELDDDRLVRKLDSYVGKKIAPAEREVMLETIRTSEALFDRQVALRSDIVGERIVPTEDAVKARSSSVGDAAATKATFDREVTKHMAAGMTRNDALSAVTRSLSAGTQEAS